MDIPTLGIDGACLSIIGQLGESRGVLIFPSLDGFERFLAAANVGRREHGAITMGTELLSITFQHATELPPSMYREAMRTNPPGGRCSGPKAKTHDGCDVRRLLVA